MTPNRKDHMAHKDDSTARHSNAYNLFILLLTEFSLILMVLLLLPLDRETLILLQFYDILICLIFLVDFFTNLRGAPRKPDCFIGDGYHRRSGQPFIPPADRFAL